MFQIGDYVSLKKFPTSHYIVVECGEGGVLDSGGGIWMVGVGNPEEYAQRENPENVILIESELYKSYGTEFKESGEYKLNDI